ncbi:MAG: SusD/RagB family nutrient-binding outer membrane lipoprotein [Flavobacteriales bacterium]|nr:SusD/RagB family nutrient-binding outer membrane lipoprotein [Flavobacteriales bacterium]MCB9449759.1 SusD/RagB family nutrient-binding outer membrane lipoprotein [Flavobacteriales bacterium]
MKITKYIAVGLIGMTALSCTKLEEFNKDTKHPEEVTGNTLFSNALRNMCDQETSTNVNRNVFRLFAQYWTETTYTDESNYNITTRSIPDYAWRTWYRDVLGNFQQAAKVIGEETTLTTSEEVAKSNRLAIIEILNVYAYQHLVDLFGNIPYSQALNIGNVLPKYDDAAAIYVDLISRLDAANSALNTGGSSFANGSDMIYNGDVAKWKTFANSLKLKLGIALADADATLAKNTVESAYGAGVISGAGDNAALQYFASSPNTNPLYVDLELSGRKDFIPANTLVDLMNNLNDPRRNDYFMDNLSDSLGPIYKGGIYGASNSYGSYTHIDDTTIVKNPTLEMLLLDYTEVQFYLAEAAERGYSVGGTVEDYYKSGITSSILYWGGTIKEDSTYQAQTDVAFSSAPGTNLEKIGTQAWLAFYNRGFLGWTTWRRLDAPAFNPPTGLTTADIPKRYTYPANEQTLNTASYTSAASAIGGDELTTKLFWDKN